MAGTGTSHQFVTLDGTPCDWPTLRGQIDRLADRMRSEPKRVDPEFGRPVDLVRLEQHILRTHGAALRSYRRAWRRLDAFAAMQRGERPMYFGRDNRRKRDGFAKDYRGYAWAREEVETEMRAARPRTRREDPLRSDLIRTVRDFVLHSTHPDHDPGKLERGIGTMADRLTAAYLRLRFPTLCNGLTADRVRRLPSLHPRKP